MNDVENVLRDALAARAAGVRHDPDAYAAVVRRRERRGLRRIATIGIAAASVAAVAVTVAVARPQPDPAPVLAAPAPARFAAVVNDMATLFYSDTHQSRGATTPVGYTTTAVAAYGDGRRFVTAAVKRCRTTFAHYEVTSDTPGDRASYLKRVPGADIDGRVLLMAVSPDGTRLAYAVRFGAPDGDCGNGGQIRVRNLTTGGERAWHDKRVLDSTSPPFAVTSLTWSADGRYLSLGEGRNVLDTTQPRAMAEYLPTETYEVPGYDFCGVDDRVFRGTTGDTVVLLRCYLGNARDGRTQNVAFVFDPATGKVGERLFTLPERTQLDPQFLAFDRSGDHAFVKVLDLSVRGGPLQLYRWDRGAGVREVDLGGKDARQIAW